MNPRVRAVAPSDDYKLVISFTNQEVGIFDCAPLLTLGVFKELEDIRYFRRARAQDGTVVWPNGALSQHLLGQAQRGRSEGRGALTPSSLILEWDALIDAAGLTIRPETRDKKS